MTKIMIFGTFDHWHKGHESFFKQARKLAAKPFLIVSIARDVNVKKIKSKLPDHTERQRAARVKNTGLADKVLLGSKTNYLQHIIKEKPEIIALGYDQKAYTQNLKKTLEENGLATKVVRLRSFKPHLYKSSLVKNNKTL